MTLQVYVKFLSIGACGFISLYSIKRRLSCWGRRRMDVKDLRTHKFDICTEHFLKQ